MTLPSLVGYPPAEAERIATEQNITIVWAETEKPRWLSPHNEPRVGRQRTLPDGKVELLRVYVPALPAGD